MVQKQRKSVLWWKQRNAAWGFESPNGTNLKAFGFVCSRVETNKNLMEIKKLAAVAAIIAAVYGGTIENAEKGMFSASLLAFNDMKGGEL